MEHVLFLILAIMGITIGISWLKDGLFNKESGFVTMGAKGKITKKLAQIFHNTYSILMIIAATCLALWSIYDILKQS